MYQRTVLRFFSGLHCKCTLFGANKDVIFKTTKTRTMNTFRQFPGCNTSGVHIELLRPIEHLKLFSLNVHGQPGRRCTMLWTLCLQTGKGIWGNRIITQCQSCSPVMECRHCSLLLYRSGAIHPVWP